MNLSFKRYLFGSTCVEYVIDHNTDQIAMVLVPAGLQSDFENRREWLNIPELMEIGMDGKAWSVGNLCHLSIGGCAQSKGAGETLKHGPATKSMKFVSQNQICEQNRTSIVTVLQSSEMHEIEHHLTWYEGEDGFEVTTQFTNHSLEPVYLELMTSVSLDNLNPFEREDNQDNLILHRFLGGWSLEGKHVEDSLEKLNLERSWMCSFPESERFGSIGSYPVHRYFPMSVIEDKKREVYWGIQLESPASWQMEVSRDGDCYSFSAGIADAEFGAWGKTVFPKESFIAPKAYISCSNQSLDAVCNQILNMHHKYTDEQPNIEHDLPIIFNDWCASYGEPSHAKTLAYADKLSNSPVKYIVVDAGWTNAKEKSFGQGGNGDWDYSEMKFPKGLLETSRILKKKGFVFGIWFELEVTTKGAAVYEKGFDGLHLTRTGNIINTGGDRTFWDFRKRETIQYLTEKVLNFIKVNEIGYLKIDYNSSIGIGCDGAESLGEGLRQQIIAVQSFLRTIRTKLPNLVIENCAAGGHRLEASFMNLTAMSSFSDAHECIELPCIAADLQRLVLARQNQIWVVVNERLSVKEFNYRLASAFLGRFCLSGNIEEISFEKWEIVEKAMKFYQKVSEIIKWQQAEVYRTGYTNTRHPKGLQIVKRQTASQVLLVIHSFEAMSDYELDLPRVPNKKWKISELLGTGQYQLELDETLKIRNIEELEGIVLLIELGE